MEEKTMGFENCITETKGTYALKFGNNPTVMYSTRDAAEKRLNQLIQEAYKNNIATSNGTYSVKYGDNPTRMFTNRDDAIKFLNKQMSTPVTKPAQNVLSGVSALKEGGYEVKLKGCPATRFTNEADAIKYYNKLVNETMKSSIIPNPDGGFDVKFADGPTRRFSTKEQAEKFLKKQLGIKDMPPANVKPDKNTGKQSKNIFKRFGSWVKKTWKSGAKGKAGIILAAATLGVVGLIAGVAALNGRKKIAEAVQSEHVQEETAKTPEEQVAKTPEASPKEEQAAPVIEEPLQIAEVPEAPQYKPQAPVDEAGNYTAVKGDGEYIIAEKLLNDYKQTHPDFEVSQQNIALLADKLIKERNATLGIADDPTKRISRPMMHPNDKIKVPDLDELFKTKLNIQS